MYIYHPRTGRFDQAVRSHVRAKSLAPFSTRRTTVDDDLYTPFRTVHHQSYDTSGSDNYTRSQVNRELMMSTAAMEDNYDLSTRSRNKDRNVLSLANKAIEDTEIHSSPRVAVAVRRSMRGHSTPPAGARVVRKTEAALLGNKVDVVLPERTTRRPKSSYAQAKLREIRREHRDITPVVVAEQTSELRAHRPVQKPSLVKPIRDVDGVKKPNIMSWQYRLDTYTNPDDLLVVPRSLETLKTQLRGIHDKVDKHRQLVDRYNMADTGLNSDDMRAIAASKAHLGTRT